MPLKNLLPPVQLISLRRASINCHCVGKDALIAWVITSINTNKKYMKKIRLNFFIQNGNFIGKDLLFIAIIMHVV